MSRIRHHGVARSRELSPLKVILRGNIPGWLDPSPEHLAAARAFLFDKWRERARERGQADPIDLADACKFASVFVQGVFGGRLRGNWHHQWVEHPTVGRIDLTDEAGVKGHSARCLHGKCAQGAINSHDSYFWANPDHRESLASVLPRVRNWMMEFGTKGQQS